jgi:hypothetical protein
MVLGSVKTLAYGAALMPAKSRLSRERWIEAALDALADGGVAAVAVEPLAARLGVTKGSFLPGRPAAGRRRPTPGGSPPRPPSLRRRPGPLPDRGALNAHRPTERQLRPLIRELVDAFLR